MAKATYEMDMTQGPLLGKLIRFSIPLILTGLLQLLYNAADVVVVGRFAGANALAAVSSTGALINLLINLFMGLSIGTSVVVAQDYGANDARGVSDTVHTSIMLAVVCGLVVTVGGMALGRPILRLMGSPDEVIDLSTLYIVIYFGGSLFNMLYNFGAGILRAVGDTRRPMYILILSGLLNVGLNLVFVLGLHMSVAGVALATVASQAMSAILVLRCLIHTDSSIRLNLRKLRMVTGKAAQIVRVGLPAGLQSTIFSISNVLIQSSVNSFGADAMAGNGAASNIEGFVYVAMNAMYTACLTFTSQNVGAKNGERLGRILALSEACVFVVGLVMGYMGFWLRRPLLGIYCTEAHVIELGQSRMSIILTTYFLCGMMDVVVGSLRGMGESVIPMIVSIVGACLLRVVWIYTIFAAHRTLPTLYLSYPVSWFLTGMVHFLCFFHVKKKTICRMTESMAASTAKPL